jgi:hypothetical protein
VKLNRGNLSQSGDMQFHWEVIAEGDQGPGPRSRHGLVYDRAAMATVLFGGIIWDAAGSLVNDTWELHGGEWRPVESPRNPLPRHRGAMVYDALLGCSVLFGGQSNDGGMLGDTWFYEDRQWRRWRPRWWSRMPRPRCGHALAFNEAEGLTVLFGGIARGDNTLGDTWVFDGRNWQIAPDPAPPPRRYAALAYDPYLQGCVLHGGSVDDHGHEQFADAWLFRGGGWLRLPHSFDADCRDDHGMAFHYAAQRLVMLEGINGARGLLVREASGWQNANLVEMHPRHQCSPLAWDIGLNGLVMHGGEARHGGPQMDATLALRAV